MTAKDHIWLGQVCISSRLMLATSFALIRFRSMLPTSPWAVPAWKRRRHVTDQPRGTSLTRSRHGRPCTAHQLETLLPHFLPSSLFHPVTFAHTGLVRRILPAEGPLSTPSPTQTSIAYALQLASTLRPARRDFDIAASRFPRTRTSLRSTGDDEPFPACSLPAVEAQLGHLGMVQRSCAARKDVHVGSCGRRSPQILSASAMR